MTHSESLFQEYLDARDVRWEHEPIVVGKAKRPDYLVRWDEKPYWFEIKGFGDPGVKPTGGFRSGPSIVEKITQARKKFKEYKEECCALVLHNCTSVHRSTRPPEVLAAAFGEYTEWEPQNWELLSDKPPRFKFRGSSQLNQKHSTTISAIIILEHFELHERLIDAFYELKERDARGETLCPAAFSEILQERSDLPNLISYSGTVRVRVLKNPFARFKLPTDLFCGPFDQHWEIDKSSRCFSLSWIGSELKQLRARVRPVPFRWL